MEYLEKVDNVKGKVSWTSRWMTKEEAEARGMPVPEHAGQPILPEHMPGAIQNPTGESTNLVTTVGLAKFVQDVGYGLTPVLARYMAVGSSNTAVNTADTTLTTEITNHGWARADCSTGVGNSITAVTTTLTGDTLQLVSAFTLTAGTDIVQEIGILSAASVGSLFTHALTGAIQLPSGAVVTITYKIVFASA